MHDLTRLERAGAAPALHADGSGWISHDSLAARADAAVAALPPRTLFALEFSNTPGAVCAYLGALRRGHVPLLVDPELAPVLKQDLCAHCGITRIHDGHGWLQIAPGRDAGRAPELHPELALLMSTSGSTGSPKLVRLSLANLQANAESIADALGLTPADRAISSLPLHYAYGLSVLNSHLAAGAAMVLGSEALTSAAFWQRFRDHRITGLAGVPTAWRLLRRLRFERMALPTLRLMTQAGGPLDAEEVRWLAQLAAEQRRRLFIMYGQSEATARIACLAPERAQAKPGSIGQAIPGGTLTLRNADGAEIEASGVEGELEYRGPNVMLGYAQSRADLALGRCTEALRTGDLGWRDADGDYWITGRRHRFIKLFGHRCALDEVDRQLRAFGLDAAATGRDDCLMVGLVGAAAQAQALRERLSLLYRVHPSAIVVRPLAALPRNSAGKLLQAELLSILTAPCAEAPA